MKTTLLLILLLAFILPVFRTQQTSSEKYENFQGPVDKFMYGKIDENTDGQSYHYINLERIQKKYLFFRVTPFSNNQYGKIGLSIYIKGEKTLLTSCIGDRYDTCFIKGNQLKQNDTVLVIVACEAQCRYGLYTYWADLQHLLPNHDIRFTFQEKDPTQLFHLKLQNELFDQIRIVLKPQTYREPMDNLKMFLNYGLSEEPSPQRHNVASLHVWNDAQAIFISKQQAKDAEGAMLLISGNAKTVYILSCEFITKDHHDLQLNETLYEYIPPTTKTFYHIQLPSDEKYNQYSVKFSVFTGEVKVGFFYDKEFKNQIQQPKAQYMSDLQFIIKKQHIKEDTKQMFIKVHSTDTIATYALNFQARQSTKAHQIYEYMYQFVTFKQNQVIYFQDDFYSENSLYESYENAEYSVKFINVNGMPKIEWRVCLGQQFQSCTNLQDRTFHEYTKQINPISVSEVGLTKIFKLSLKKSDFASINSMEKRIMVLMILSNKGQDYIDVAIEYSNDERVRILRDDRVIQEKVTGMSSKLYKYVNNDPTVKKIAFHLNTISGQVQVEAQRSDYRAGNGNSLSINEQKFNVLQVTENVTQPIYMKLQGLVNSIYTLSVTTYHEEHLGTASLTISEDVTYNLKIAPGQSINLDMNPVFSKISFQYQAEGSVVSVCVLEGKHCSDSPQLNKPFDNEGTIIIDDKDMHSKTFRLYNLGDQNNVVVKVIFHSGDYQHCQQRKLNEVYNENVKHQQCFRFDLPLAADIQVTTIREDLGKNTLFFYACSKMIDLTPSKYKSYISASDIRNNCKGQLDDISIFLAIADSKKSDFKLQYVLEYRGDVVTLKDGIAYNGKGISRQGAVRQFFYPAINVKETEVILLNKKGIQKFELSITNQTDKYLSFTAEKKTISSSASNYYTNPTIKVTPQQIKEAKCESCIIAIQVFSDENVGEQVQFTIQVTQNSALLNEDEVRSDFLSEGSVDYYEYENRLQGKTIYVKVSEQNPNCAKIYFGNKEYPTSVNNLQQQSGSQLVFQNPQKKRYYLAVQAIENCPYSISISQSDTKITRIRVGQFYDIKLQQNQKKYFLVRYLSKESFKVMYIEKSGTVKIFANKTQITATLLKQLSDDKLSSQDFSFSSQYKNSLFIDNQDQKFCSDCYYLIMVVAKTQVESTIVISDQRTQIPLGDGKILFDEIHTENSTTVLKTDKVRPGKLYAKVHAGSIKVSMTYKDKLIENQYKRDKKVVTTQYDFTRAEKDWSPLIVTITATQAPALYSIELKANPKIKQNHFESVKPGESSFVYLDPDRVACLKGFIHKREEEIILTSNIQNSHKLHRLAINASLDENDKIQIKNQTVGNIMTIQFKIKQMYSKGTLPFQLCLQSTKNDSFTVTVLQEDDVNLLPADVETRVKNNSTFVIHPSGLFLIDLFQCRGQSKIKYASQIAKLDETEDQKLQKIGMSGQSHAVKIQKYTTVFVKVQGEFSTINWMPIDEDKERGIGYDKYGINTFTYKSSITSIQFQIEGVKRLKDSKTIVESVRYFIYMSNSKEKLQEAIQCETVENQHVAKMYVGKFGQKFLGKIITPSMKKSTISDKFHNQTVYFNVVADMVLKVPLKEQNITQNYRFIYFEQTAPVEVFTSLNLQNPTYELMIVIGIVLIVIVLVVGCVFVKCIVPGIGKLKNRMFVEESNEDKKDDSIPIPPSSDRNRIQANVQTDQKIE